MPTPATQSLAQALKRAESDLGLVLEYRAVLLPQHLHTGVQDVWPVIQQHIAELRNALLEAPDEIDKQLEPVGLTGAQLEMKLSAHRTASDRAHEAGHPRRPEPPTGFRRIFRSLLGWINVWLGSLVAALGSGEAIKEFKEFLEQGVDDVENFG